MIAYGVSRYRILSEVRMFQLLILRMIPPIVIVAPLSLYYTAIGLIDTRIGLILVYFLTTLPYAVWMTRSFIDEVPLEVEPTAALAYMLSEQKFWDLELDQFLGSTIAGRDAGRD